MASQKQRILFAGTPHFAAAHLSALLQGGHHLVGVYTQPDRPGKRGRKPQASPVKEVALRAGLPVHQPEKLDARELTRMRSLAPDVMVVVAYGHKLGRDMLALPAQGCINVHASLLPRWRGAAPIQRALLAGDTETGVSIMRMDEGWDTGPVFLQRACPIAADDTAGSLEERLCSLGQEALDQVLEALANGTAEARTQPGEGVTWAAKISKEEALIDWSGSAARIARQVRAFLPAPVAFTWFGDMRVRIWHAVEGAESEAHHPASPGELVAVGRQGIDVCCGDGLLRLTHLQLPIGKGTVLTVADLLNARRDLFVPGARFRDAPPVATVADE